MNVPDDAPSPPGSTAPGRVPGASADEPDLEDEEEVPDVGHLDVAACERVFRRNGLPLLVEDYSVGRDVFGRSAPFLLVVLLLELSGAVRLGWPAWVNALAVLGAAVLLGAAYAGLNLLRGRPWSTLPQDVGVPELTFFVLAPAVVPLVFGGAWDEGLLTAVGNLVLLGVVRVVVGYGLASSLWWGLARVVDELAISLLRLIRLLPLLLVFSLVLFFSADVWQVFDRTHGHADLLLGGFFALVILTFVLLRVPTEARIALRGAAAAVPGGRRAARLTRPQRVNLATMIGISQLLQVLVVSVGMGLFYIAVGMLTISPEVMTIWRVQGGTWVEPVQVLGADLVISQTLLRVSVAIATFTGLYYAIAVQVDAVYRGEFVEGIGTQLRHVLATRVRYLDLTREATSREVEPQSAG